MSDQTVVAKAVYTYDAAGNRTSMTDLAGTHTYEYDDLHRLTVAHHPAASKLAVKDETFSYDAVGNRLADAQVSGYTYDASNRLIESSSFTYAYDSSGNRIGKTGRATGQSTSYDYDSENHMLAAATSSGDSFSFSHDARGRRIEKSSGTTPSQAIRYVYDGANILALLDAANNANIVATYAPVLTAPISILHADGTESFHHADALGSAISLTNGGGAVTETIEYRVFGRPVFIAASGAASTTRSFVGNPFGFTGLIYDTEMELHKPMWRAYDADTGLFTQEDPILFLGGDVNPGT